MLLNSQLVADLNFFKTKTGCCFQRQVIYMSTVEKLYKEFEALSPGEKSGIFKPCKALQWGGVGCSRLRCIFLLLWWWTFDWSWKRSYWGSRGRSQGQQQYPLRRSQKGTGFMKVTLSPAALPPKLQQNQSCARWKRRYSIRPHNELSFWRTSSSITLSSGPGTKWARLGTAAA